MEREGLDSFMDFDLENSKRADMDIDGDKCMGDGRIKRLTFETCCGSAEDVYQSFLGGADRVELNSALALGGLTPSMGEFRLARKQDIPIMVMVRPRSGGFCYTESEYETMLYDAEAFLSAGADGIVFGFLNSDGTVDIKRCKEMVALTGDKEAVFHRAFDVVPDWKEAMDILVDIGIKRILTSGQKRSAPEGKDVIKEMISYAAGRIEILPGAGIREGNVRDLLDTTGCRQLHMSVRASFMDFSLQSNPAINFGHPAIPEDSRYDIMDAVNLKRVITALRQEYDC